MISCLLARWQSRRIATRAFTSSRCSSLGAEEPISGRGAECWSASAFDEARDHVLPSLPLNPPLPPPLPSPYSFSRVDCPLASSAYEGSPIPMTGNEDYVTGVTCSRSVGFERIAFRSGFRSAPRLALPPPFPSRGRQRLATARRGEIKI